MHRSIFVCFKKNVHLYVLRRMSDRDYTGDISLWEGYKKLYTARTSYNNHLTKAEGTVLKSGDCLLRLNLIVGGLLCPIFTYTVKPL